MMRVSLSNGWQLYTEDESIIDDLYNMEPVIRIDTVYNGKAKTYHVNSAHIVCAEDLGDMDPAQIGSWKACGKGEA